MSTELERQQAIMQNLEHARFPYPHNERERLATLMGYDVLDSLPEQSYDDLTAIAAHICGTPIALVSLLDGDRQWFKSHYGIDATETPREHAFCAHAIMNPDDVLVVSNALEDERFRENPLVTGAPNIRFYAGTPLVNPEGMPLGTLCVIDQSPRELTSQQHDALQALGRQVVAQLELRRQTAQLQRDKQELQQVLQTLKITQANLVESERMSAIGELVVSIAQKLSNPLTFIQGNLAFAQKYTQQLLEMILLYQQEATNREAIDNFRQEIDFDYLLQDLPKLFSSMRNGVNQVQETISSLRTFAHPDEDGTKLVNLHDNLDAVCRLLSGSFQETATEPAVTLVKRYGELPYVPCKPRQLNQALMHLVSNAIDAIRRRSGSKNQTIPSPQVTITTSFVDGDRVQVVISDNSQAMGDARPDIFMSPTARKADMGLAISHRIIAQEHNGSLTCQSHLGRGTEMVVTLPTLPRSTVELKREPVAEGTKV